MPAAPTETPRALLAAWPARTGLPAALLAGLPASVVLFAVEGHPAFGVAVLTALSGSHQAVARMRAYEGALHDALRDLGFRMDVAYEGPAGGVVDRLADQIRLLQGTLTPAQVDQLGRIFEALMSATDADWHELLLRAVRAVVKDVVEEVSGRIVVARLSVLSPGTLAELQRLRDRPDRPRTRTRPRELTAAQVVLLTLGFVREGGVAPHEGPANVAAVRVPSADPPAAGELRLTPLGFAALRLFGPIDLNP